MTADPDPDPIEQVARLLDPTLLQRDGAEIDDLAIPTVAGGLFRMERMDNGHVWLALYDASGNRWTFNLTSKRRISIYDEDER